MENIQLRLLKRPYQLQFVFLFFTIFIIANLNSDAQTGSIIDSVDKFIRINRINDRLLLVTMGADAVTAIATKKGLIVIDAGISKTLTSKYRKVIENEVGRSDFIYLINTHGHSDHCGGNSVFKDAVAIGYENCPLDARVRMKDPEKTKANLAKIVAEYDKQINNSEPGSADWEDAYCQKIRYQNAYNDFCDYPVATVWDSTFKDSMHLDEGDISLDMIYFGKAHSASDILIFVPELKLLMTGDLFFSYGRPSLIAFDPVDGSGIKESLGWLTVRKKDIDTVIGGHGQIMTRIDLEAFISNMGKRLAEVNQ